MPPAYLSSPAGCTSGSWDLSVCLSQSNAPFPHRLGAPRWHLPPRDAPSWLLSEERQPLLMLSFSTSWRSHNPKTSRQKCYIGPRVGSSRSSALLPCPQASGQVEEKEKGEECCVLLWFNQHRRMLGVSSSRGTGSVPCTMGLGAKGLGCYWSGRSSTAQVLGGRYGPKAVKMRRAQHTQPLPSRVLTRTSPQLFISSEMLRAGIAAFLPPSCP